MKKIIVLLLCICAMTACSSSNELKVSDADSVIINAGKETYTKQDLFEDLKLNDYSSIIETNLLMDIAALEGVDFNSFEQDINNEIAEVKAMYGDLYLTLMDYYGGEEGFREMLLSSFVIETLANNYYEANYETLKAEYKPVQAQLAYFSTLEEANAFIEAVQTDSTFDMAALEFGYTTSTQVTVYTDKDSLAYEVKDYLNNHTELGLSTAIETATATTDADGNVVENYRYYVINVIDNNPDNFKEAFFNTLGTYLSPQEINNYYFEQYDIEFYDQKTYEMMAGLYTGLE